MTARLPILFIAAAVLSPLSAQPGPRVPRPAPSGNEADAPSSWVRTEGSGMVDEANVRTAREVDGLAPLGHDLLREELLRGGHLGETREAAM